MDNSPIILFDGVCNYCNRMVNFAIRNDPKGKLRFTPMQSPAGQRLRQQYQVPGNVDSIVLIDNNRAYLYSTASLRICKYLRWPAKILAALLVVPAFIRNPIYKWIARNRYKWWGEKDSCMVPTPEVRSRFVMED